MVPFKGQVFFVMMKQRALRHGTLRSSREMNVEE
jgi:hypothetical protein